MSARLRKLLIESPELGELLLAVGAGKVAISSRREAAKAISATPFDDGAADGAVVSAAREHRENVESAIAKEGEAVMRFASVKEAAPTAEERVELAAPGPGKQEAAASLLGQTALGAGAHSEARERVKGLVIVAPPPPKLDARPEAAAGVMRAWSREVAGAVKAWTTHIHDVYAPGSR